MEEVEAALALGLEVVISDHHSPRPDGVLPRAPIVHPGVCGYPCRDLCATAVAYKLAQALYGARGRDPAELEAELDLVALATIADVVPLLGENRTLAVRGLRRLESTTRPGLRALMEVARVAPGRAGERAVAFGLAPRLNAAGRLYRADAALELLLTEDPAPRPAGGARARLGQPRAPAPRARDPPPGRSPDDRAGGAGGVRALPARAGIRA